MLKFLEMKLNNIMFFKLLRYSCFSYFIFPTSAQQRNFLRVHLSFEESQKFIAFREQGIGKKYFCKYEIHPFLRHAF